MSTVIQIRRGLKADLPNSAALGELLLTIDTSELFYGQGPNLPLKPLVIRPPVEYDVSSQIDNTNKIFYVPESYVPGTIKVKYNGIYLVKSNNNETRDFKELNPIEGSIEFETIVPKTYPVKDSIIIEYAKIPL